MRWLLRWAVVAAYCGLIFFLSHLSKFPRPLELHFFSADKLLHVGGYALLSLSFAWALTTTSRRLCIRTVVFATCLFTIGFGALDEVHQSFIPGRHATIYDVLADALGAGVGIGLWMLVRSWHRRRQTA